MYKRGGSLWSLLVASNGAVKGSDILFKLLIIFFVILIKYVIIIIISFTEDIKCLRKYCCRSKSLQDISETK